MALNSRRFTAPTTPAAPAAVPKPAPMTNRKRALPTPSLTVRSTPTTTTARAAAAPRMSKVRPRTGGAGRSGGASNYANSKFKKRR